MANANFARRKNRVRYKLRSKTSNPRLSVYISNANIYAQVIDDAEGKTVASASSVELKSKTLTKDVAAKVGALIAEKAKKAKVEAVVFDRGGYIYHGRVQALAEAAREGGLKF